MDATLSQILTYMYATLQKNAQLEAEVAALKQEIERLTPRTTP